MSHEILLVLLFAPMVLALGLGVWIGLGYPGLHGRYEKARRSPWELFVDWIVERLDGR